MNVITKWNELLSRESLLDHFQERIKTKPSIGLDKISVTCFESRIDEELEIIERKVKTGKYCFTRYRQVLISKGAGRAPREISIPTVRDKLVTSILNDLLVEVFGEQTKSPLPQLVLASIQKELLFYDYYIRIDISKFYSSIDHQGMMRIVRRKIRKKEILSLVENAITTESIALPIKEPLKRERREKGIPEGLPISNSLANLFLSDIDKKYMSDYEIKYYRYVDDILILVKGDDPESFQNGILRDLKKHGLEANPEKSEMGVISKPFSYLGYYICDKFFSVSKRGIYRIENSIEKLIKECKNNNLKYLEWKLNIKITGFIIDEHKYGWVFFYSQITDTSVLHHLDWFVNKILTRYRLQDNIHVKKFVRSFFEITKKLHETRYIPNMNEYSIEDKRLILSEIYSEKVDGFQNSRIEALFRKIMRREIQDVERDVENFS